MATIPNALNTHLTAEQVMTSFDNALTKYPATKSEVETARGTFENLDARLDDMDTTLNSAKLGIKYKGEVNYYADLPNSAEIGDAYTVKYAGSSGTTPDGTEYVWGTVSGTNQWINFSKDSYTKAEVDALLALKQNALTTAQLAAVNSGIDSTKVAQIETNKNNILISDITSNFVAVSGYTITNVSFVYRQGKHVFGHLWIHKNSGNFDSQSLEYCVDNTIDKAQYSYPQECFFATSNWKLENTGYGFITEQTHINVRAGANGFNYALIKIDYISQ